ncbi:MAG TPA: hypothetical protein VIC84_19565 [Blastocatellia bacterium]
MDEILAKDMSFASRYVTLEASVKDGKRFPGGWAYYGFTDMTGKSIEKARPFPDSACLSCPQQKPRPIASSPSFIQR